MNGGANDSEVMMMAEKERSSDANANGYTQKELMAAAGARELGDGEIVFVGTGMPLVSSFLAKYTHAPDLQMVVESGPIDPQPIDIPLTIADPRCFYRAVFHGGVRDVLGALLQRGKVDVGFLGGAQIDRYGNINSSYIGSREKPKVRLPGSGGACDIACLSKRTIITCVHEKRRFPERVDYTTSPGYLGGRTEREKLGLQGGPSAMITDLCVMDFNDEGLMRLRSLHPGVALETVLERMAFEPVLPADPTTIPRTEPPTTKQLRLLREKIDPNGIYLD